MSGHVAVIGAGIVGLSTAIWLRRFGVDVTVIDRDGPGAGASFGNAGVLAASAVAPTLVPGMVPRVPGMLADRDAPLFLRWGYLPRLLPWLARALPNARDARVREIATALAPLVADAPEQHLALTEGLSARRFVVPGPYRFAYRDRRAFEADAYGWARKAEAGFVPEIAEGQAVREVEPALSETVGLLATLRHHGHIADPGGYCAALGADLEALGGRHLRAEARAVTVEGDRVTGVETTAGTVACDHAVVAAGAFSGALLRRAGLRLPLESERGYHLQFEGAGGPRAPVMVAAGAFVATPMATGMRAAGVLEFGGLAAGPSVAPLGLLRRGVARAFPGLGTGCVTEWMGHRPALPDSLPALGRCGAAGLWAALGHHHVGLTAGPKSGRLLAQAIAGRAPNIDLAPYRPDRFS